jgi:N-acetylmuramoyl-L-alanine amidase
MTASKIRPLEAPSPNHDARDGQAIDMLVLHYTGMRTGDEALRRLCDPNSKVSAHYMIEEDGRIFRLVPEDRRAWHAGVACWAGRRDINARSIGIELVNPGHEFGYRDFTAQQIDSLVILCTDILARHAIAPERVLGHSDVAPARKQDPGERLDWAALARAGIGLWPVPTATDDATAGNAPKAESAFLEQLALFGYATDDAPPQEVIAAFQRHFRPSAVTGQADAECAGRLAALLRHLDLSNADA